MNFIIKVHFRWSSEFRLQAAFTPRFAGVCRLKAELRTLEKYQQPQKNEIVKERK